MPKNKKKNNKLKALLNKIKNNKIKFNLLDVIIIVIISIALGSIIGASIIYNKEQISITNVPKELDEFVKTYNSINENYYKKVKKEELIDAAIEGMINSLDDPYSNYMDENDTETFNETIDGEYVGIGVTVNIKEDCLEVLEVRDESTAKDAGIKTGDKIIEIDGKSVKKKTSQEISGLIKGNTNTKVKLKVLRDDKELEFNIKRKSVEISSVESKVIEKDSKKTGYIYINVFASNTYKQFKNNLEKLEDNKIDSLIIDVRNNPGGHLNQVTKILELFLDKKKVLYQIKTKNNVTKVHSTTSEKRNYKIAVLINKSSASASEILASAIKESYKGTIVGITSLGKGTVQKSYELANGTSLKYTTEEWLTPKGNSINKKGIVPDEEVELSDDYYNNQTDENDNQLQKALEIVTKSE